MVNEASLRVGNHDYITLSLGLICDLNELSVVRSGKRYRFKWLSTGITGTISKPGAGSLHQILVELVGRTKIRRVTDKDGRWLRRTVTLNEPTQVDWVPAST